MDSVLSRLRQQLDYLTPSEVKVAEYCLNNPDSFLTDSIYGIADAAGVSIASVSRLAATLGYKNWKEMRLALAKESGTADNPIFPRITQEDPDEAVVERVFNGNVVGIQTTLRKIDKTKIIEVVKRIRNCSRIMFFGSGGSGYQALDEALRFSHLKPIAQACTEDYQMMLQAAKMREGEMAFGFSNSGRTVSTVRVLEEAKKAGAVTVGIANFPNTPLEKASDYFFRTAFPDFGDITASLTARAGLLSIMDAIYVLAAQYGAISEKVGYMDEVLETSFRAPSGRKLKKRGQEKDDHAP